MPQAQLSDKEQEEKTARLQRSLDVLQQPSASSERRAPSSSRRHCRLGVKGFAVVEEVWVCGWSYAGALATALRTSMLDLHQARRTTEGRDTKMHVLYDHLIGHEFSEPHHGVIESMVSLQEQLRHEQRAFTRIWKKRGTTVTRAPAPTRRAAPRRAAV